MTRNLDINFTIVETIHYDAQVTIDLDRWAAEHGASLNIEELDIDTLREWVETEEIEVREADGVVQGGEWTDPEPVTADEPKAEQQKLATELVPGDRYLQYIDSLPVTVKIVGGQEPYEGLGLPFVQYLAEVDGETGYVKFGPKDTVVVR